MVDGLTTIPRNLVGLHLPSPLLSQKNRTISWFKNTAHEYIDQARVLVGILEHHGVSVRMLKTSRVGYIVYEDEFQIVAEAFVEGQY